MLETSRTKSLKVCANIVLGSAYPSKFCQKTPKFSSVASSQQAPKIVPERKQFSYDELGLTGYKILLHLHSHRPIGDLQKPD